jgi:3-hydroxyisobutyrate dehydrogenase
VVHSTVHPDTCGALGSAAAAHQIDLLGVPVSGGRRSAQTEALSIMVGGAEQVLNDCCAVLLEMGHVTHLGDSGTGQTANKVVIGDVHGVV